MPVPSVVGSPREELADVRLAPARLVWFDRRVRAVAVLAQKPKSDAEVTAIAPRDLNRDWSVRIISCFQPHLILNKQDAVAPSTKTLLPLRPPTKLVGKLAPSKASAENKLAICDNCGVQVC